MKGFFSGAAPLAADTIADLKDLTGATMCEVYGSTETTAMATITPWGGEIKPGTVGVPVADTDIKIMAVDDPDKELLMRFFEDELMFMSELEHQEALEQMRSKLAERRAQMEMEAQAAVEEDNSGMAMGGPGYDTKMGGTPPAAVNSEMMSAEGGAQIPLGEQGMME